MDTERKFLGEIKIAIELNPLLKSFTASGGKDRRALNGFLDQYLNELIEDLKIPVEISLDLGLYPNEEKNVENLYRITINGNRCRQPFMTLISDEIQAKELASSIALVIHQNRELLISTELAEELRNLWSMQLGSEYLATLSDEDFHKFLNLLVSRNFSIERGNHIDPGVEKQVDVLKTEYYFEEAISGLDKIKIIIFLSNKFYRQLDYDYFENRVNLMRERLFYELGLYLPAIHLQTDKDLENSEFRIQLNDLRLPHNRGLKHNQFLVDATVEELLLLGLKGKERVNPINGRMRAAIVGGTTELNICDSAGLTTCDWLGFNILAIAYEIRRNAGAFLSAELVKFYVQQLETIFPDLVNVVKEMIDLLDLTVILRDLLEDEISIRNLPAILEALLAINDTSRLKRKQKIQFSQFVIDQVRTQLRRQISHQFTSKDNIMFVRILDPEVERRIKGITPSKDAEHDQFIRIIQHELRNQSASLFKPIFVMRGEGRRLFRKLIEIEFPRVVVLGYNELSADFDIQPISRIVWRD